MLPAHCDPHFDPCCMGIYETADAIRRCAYEAILDCSPGVCPEWETWVSVGQPQGHGNYVVSWYERTDLPTQANRTPYVPKLTWTFGLAVVEEGFPMPKVSGESIFMPKPAEYDYAALHAYGHAERVMRALWNCALADGCQLEGVREFTSDLPAMGHVRFQARVRISAGLNR